MDFYNLLPEDQGDLIYCSRESERVVDRIVCHQLKRKMLPFSGEEIVFEGESLYFFNVDAQDKNGLTDLHISSKRGWLPRVDLLLKLGANSNVQTIYGVTPLFYAVNEDHLEIVKSLLTRADPNIQNRNDLTALHWASERSCSEILEVLLEAGANSNVQSNNGWVPLHWASINKHPGTADILIRHGANLDAVTTRGHETPLHKATRNNNHEMVKSLLKAGADPDILNSRGLSAVFYSMNDPDMSKLFLHPEEEG